jgi:dTDP-4-amino-4,6-dideoxygalactose transaminase
MAVKRTEGRLALSGGQAVRREMLPLHVPYLDEQDSRAAAEAVRSTYISGDGPRCREFEEALARYLGARHVFFTTSCTAALDLAFMAKDFMPGAEVIVPDFTFTSTALAPILNGLKVVLADVEPDTGNLDPAKVERKITSRTVAICPVDYAGRPADIECMSIAKKHGLYVVQDAAQSIGASVRGRKVGTYADVTCFSFHGTKNLAVGEGGALATESDEISKRIEILREKGTDKRSFLLDGRKTGYYEYVSKGNSYVQSDILGALGLSQLRKLGWMNQRRKAIAHYYLKELQAYDHVVRLPQRDEGVESNWHLFYILVPEGEKEWWLQALRAEGIMVNVHYTPLHQSPYYQSVCECDPKEFPGTMSFYNRLVRLPLYPSMTDSDAKDVVRAVIKVAEGRERRVE